MRMFDSWYSFIAILPRCCSIPEPDLLHCHLSKEGVRHRNAVPENSILCANSDSCSLHGLSGHIFFEFADVCNNIFNQFLVDSCCCAFNSTVAVRFSVSKTFFRVEIRDPCPFSIFEICAFPTPTFCPSSSCVRPRLFRSLRISFPISQSLLPFLFFANICKVSLTGNFLVTFMT